MFNPKQPLYTDGWNNIVDSLDVHPVGGIIGNEITRGADFLKLGLASNIVIQ